VRSENEKGGFPVQTVAIPLLIITVIFSSIYFITESDRQRLYPITTYNLTIPDDSTSIDHGKKIFTIRGCVDCHGTNLAGRIIQSGLLTGTITAPNLTPSPASPVYDYSPEDLVRAIREGVKPSGKSVIMMPSHKFQVIHKTDIESLIAYIRSVKPVDRRLPESSLNFPVRLFYFVNRNLVLFPASMIKRPIEFEDDEPMSRIERGEYIASSCVGCHGHHLEGGPIPGAPPTWPEAPDLSMTGVAGNWTKDEFIRGLKEGITADGRHIDEKFMPWKAFGQLSDEEFDLLWEYIKSLD
jgi:mono/diheme cytochrome c family protein